MAGDRASEGPSARGADTRSAALAMRLGEVLGEPLAGGVHQLSSGASRETFRFATASHGELVAQIEPAGDGASGRPAQTRLLEAAAQAGVPVPAVIATGGGDAVLGSSWTVVRALPGTTDPREILAPARDSGAARLLDSVAAALAAVHRMPADATLAPAVEDPIGVLRRSYERLGERHPTFELAFRALAGAHWPARPTFVHGDFRMGNLMVEADGVTGVLDWELAHLGDPVEDLGWLCVPAWRFTRPERPAAGLGTREQLLAAYERHAGVRVDMAQLRYWELAGTLRWGVICVMQAFKHLSGEISSVEHAVIGRRACEVEWDLLELLDPAAAGSPRSQLLGPAAAGSPRPDAAGAGSGTGTAGAPGGDARPALHDRPSAIELLGAAREALGEDVLPLLEGRAAFQLRVSMRALGIVGRELAHAETHAALRAAALARLGVADEAALAAAIRAGELMGREAELHELLRALVAAKLEVANPRYLQRSVRPLEEAT